MSAKGGGAPLAHVTREHGFLDLPQVYHDQPVERVCEIPVQIEPEEPATELELVGAEPEA